MSPNFRLRQIGWMAAGVAFTLAVGTAGFRLILKETWLQSFYRAVVTSSLTGLDTVPKNDAARLLSIAMVLAGLTIIAYIGAVIVEAIASGVLTGVLAERRRRRTIERLENHFIICGYGRVGRRVAEEFRHSGVPYVVLDFHEDALAAAKENREILVEGDATEDEDLRAAGIERARGVVASADNDADNLYIVLSARNARPELTIVARASDEDAERKLRLAGADRVVTPYTHAGRLMANLALKPQVTAFLDVVTSAAGGDFLLEEIEVAEASGQAGQSLREADVRGKTGAMIVAIRKRDGVFDTTPDPEARIDVGDVLIGVGTPEEIRRLEDFFAPREAVAG